MSTTTRPDKGAVLITGAAGGIGSVTARRLNSLGFHVFAGVRKSSDGEKLQREISTRITPVLLDITDDASIAQAVKIVSKTVGHVGLVGLVNNAGLIVEGPIEMVPMDEVRKQFEVNVIGQIAVTQAFLPLLRQGHGRIINIGAATGRITFPYMGMISASKTALESFTDALRSELHLWGLSVSIVEPMGMQTQIFEKASASAQQARQQIPEHIQRLYAPALAAIGKALANQRLDPPDLVANAIIHALTSPRPKTRYLVGRGASMIAFLRLLPDRLRDSLILRTYGLANIQPGSSVSAVQSTAFS